MEKNLLRQLIMLSKKILYAFLIQLFMCTVLLANTGNAQRKTIDEIKVSLDLKDKNLLQFFKQVESKTDFKFTYNDDLVDLKQKVTVVDNNTVYEILESVSRQTDLNFVQVNENIHVKLETGLNHKPSVQIAQMQDITVSGTVTDVNGDPIPGVTVSVPGTTIGTASDIDGKYAISVPEGSTLVFSFIGFETQRILVGNQREINVTLGENTAALDEVVVVAFGEQKKQDIIGSVTTINPSELKIPSSNLTTALAGRVAGMISYQRSGEPGQNNADFFIRGVTTFGYKVDPLILIDNVEVTTTELARIQPDDIASFSIMKDATATALYGARGANGVILITTKEGKEGKAKVSFRIENSISMPTQNVELADPVTYMKLHNEAVLTRDPLGILPYSQQKIDRTMMGVDPTVYPSTDWRRELFKDYAMSQRVNLNVSGGGKVARYYIAGSFNHDHGVLKVDSKNNFNNNISLKNYNLRSNINIDLTNSTELIIRMNGNFDDYTGPIDGGAGMYNMVMRTNPALFPAYYPVNEESRYVNHIMFGNHEEGDYVNPYAQMVRGYKDYSRAVMLAQMELKQQLSFITEGLSFRTLMNTNRSSYFDVSRSYNPYYYTVGRYERGTGEYSLYPINEDTGTEYLDYTEGPKEVSSVFYLESALSYSRTFSEKHGLSGMLVYVMRQNLSANAGSLQLSLPYRNLGLSGRATYSFDNRYFAEFNFGYNGSERFHKTQRFGFFPSVGLAWSLSNERFWEPLQAVVTNLRLRGTYGLVGNDAIGSAEDRFFYLSNIDMNAGGAVFGRDNGYSRTGVSVTRYSNEDITWETSKKMNVAMELSLFDKLGVEAEYFNEYRTNILMSRSFIPSTMGLSSDVRANVGEASGRGVDVSLDYNHYFRQDLWLQGRGNFTYATSRYEVYEEPEYDEPWRSRVGHSIQQEWGYIAERLFVDDYEVANSPRQNFGEYMAGDIKYRDVNDDGQITEADMVPIGYPTIPEIVFGFGFSTGYKNWDLSAFFQGVGRESFRIGVAATSPFIDNDGDGAVKSQNQLLQAYADNHWSEENNRDLYALWPRLSPTLINNNHQRSTWFQRDGSFLRFKQLEIGYSLSRELAERLHLSNLRVYVNGTNLMTWSKFKLWDVEMASNGLGYPIQKVFNLGLNVSF